MSQLEIQISSNTRPMNEVECLKVTGTANTAIADVVVMGSGLTDLAATLTRVEGGAKVVLFKLM